MGCWSLLICETWQGKSEVSRVQEPWQDAMANKEGAEVGQGCGPR
jgi:hypothetical protein